MSSTSILTGGINPFTSQFLTEERTSPVGFAESAVNAPFSHAFSERCWETILRNIQYRRYQVKMDGVNNFVLNSDFVPDGYWWYIHAATLTIVVFTNQIVAAVITMLSQNEKNDPPPSTGFPLLVSGIQVNDLAGPSSLGSGSSQIISTLRSLILPPRWALSAKSMVIAANIAATSGTVVELRMAVAELPLSLDPPNLL